MALSIKVKLTREDKVYFSNAETGEPIGVMVVKRDSRPGGAQLVFLFDESVKISREAILSDDEKNEFSHLGRKS